MICRSHMWGGEANPYLQRQMITVWSAQSWASWNIKSLQLWSGPEGDLKEWQMVMYGPEGLFESQALTISNTVVSGSREQRERCHATSLLSSGSILLTIRCWRVLWGLDQRVWAKENCKPTNKSLRRPIRSRRSKNAWITIFTITSHMATELIRSESVGLVSIGRSGEGRRQSTLT